MSIQQHSNDRNPPDNISCPRCHTQLPIQAVFCSSCGERVEKIMEQENGDGDIQPHLKVPLQSKSVPSLPDTPALLIAEAWQQVPETEVPALSPSRSGRLTVPTLRYAVHSRKPGVLLPVVLTRLVGIIFGASLWIYKANHSPASATSVSTSAHKATLLPSPASTVVPTPSPIFPLNIAGLYRGTIFDLSANVTTEMSLTGIQQDQRGISGNFTGLHLTGTFNGAIDPSKHIQFMVQDSAGHLILSFDGDMQSDGELSGNYCSVNQDARCSGDYGLWSVAPAS